MRKSFTLIELLIVLIIVGVLATVAIPQYMQMRDKAILAEAKQCVKAFADAIWMYYTEAGQWPLRWVPPPYGTDDLLKSTVDVHPGISKYWDWTIETNTTIAPLPYGNQATARSKGDKAYAGIMGVCIQLLPDGTKEYLWRTAEEGWISSPEGWPF
jgi:prepilin-type N-terminal cleavage/methylation domain-containing protein